MKTPTQILDDTIALLRKGWCRGRPQMESVCGRKYCLAAACDRAGLSAGDDARLAVDAAIRSEIKAATSGQCRSIVSWNDAFSRTQAEVIALVERAKGRVA